MGEAELVAGFAAGEPGSVAEVYRKYGRLVYAVTYRVLGNPLLAEDATRRTFVRAWQHAASLEPGSGLGALLATTASRTADDLRQHHRLDRLPVTAAGSAAPIGRTQSAEQVDDAWLVRRALDRLPAEDRELIRLQHDQRLTPSQISRRLAIPPASLKSRSRLAHRRLAGIIGQLRAEGHVKVPSAAENMSERRGRKETGSQRGVSGPNIVP